MASSSALIQQDGIDSSLLLSTHILAKRLLEVCHDSIGAGFVMVKELEDGEVTVTIRQYVDNMKKVDGFSQWVTTAAKESLKTAALPKWSLISMGPPIIKSRNDHGYSRYSIATTAKFNLYEAVTE